MTDRVKKLLALLKSGAYKEYRRPTEVILSPEEEAATGAMKGAYELRANLTAETPHMLEGERFGFHRTNPGCYMRRRADGSPYIPWDEGNVVPDYEAVLTRGMDDIRAELLAYREKFPENTLYSSCLLSLDAALDYVARMQKAAEEAGDDELAAALSWVPYNPPRSLYEAYVFHKFITFVLRCSTICHITLGRFDKYMRPYYNADIAAGKTREELLELTEEYFISLNFDSDLYFGVQVGDNGQSMVLGGCGSFDDFSHLIMEASLALNLIDPKINLRVDKNTPTELYEFATLMTQKGLGFPQYCNDDVVIPGLVSLGYSPEDAADYAVAACWEFIIPAKGRDIPNILTMNYPAVIRRATDKHLLSSATFEEFLASVMTELENECDSLTASVADRRLGASPALSLFMPVCFATGKDIQQGGARYHNYGCHGAGLSTAADSLAAIREVIYETGECTKKDLLAALAADFEGYGELRNRLLSCPKMGNADSRADGIGYALMERFSSYLNGKPNNMGGIFRAGTGSAHEYHYSAKKVGATPDGRRAYAPYGSSFSPSLETRLSGPLSCIRSFTGFDLKKVINGGPLTLEIHDTVFRNREGNAKVAALVKAFIQLGGHQLQLNCINREVLLDAMEHPEEHKNLIVRVWGWSGYFNELERPFKEHILKRTEFSF